MRFTCVSLACVAFGVMITAAIAQDQRADDRPAAAKNANAKDAEIATMFRSSDVVGLEVRNKANKDLGNIKDLVVDMSTGHVRYAALSFGGFAGLGNKLFAVPWEAMTFKFGEKEHFVVFDVTEQQLKQAPGFDESNWPNIADPAWAASIDKHYNIERKAAEQGQPKAGERKVADNIVYDAAFRASTIKGMKVKDNAGKDLGSVNELVLDLKDGIVRYGVLSSGGVVGIGAKLHAIPFQEFKLHHTADQKFFNLAVTPEKLREAPSFDSNRWPNLSDAQWANEIDRHYGTVRTAERPATRKDKDNE
jgi:sporulation protein YlmC with PRC-barrel domain